MICMVALLMAAPACKTRKDARSGRTARDMTAEKLIAKNKQATAKYQTLSVKGKADLENPQDGKTISFSYKANIAKDSLIWATVSKFGLPLATLLADPDSVRIRRLDVKEVVICDYSVLNKAAGMKVDFALLQNLFTGETQELEGKQLELSTANNQYQLSGQHAHYAVNWIFDPANYKLIQMEVEDATLGMASTLTYGNFMEVESQLVPSVVNLDVKSPNAMKLKLEHSQIALDDPDTDFSFRIPKSYEIKDCKL
jgi:hypothetical protein